MKVRPTITIKMSKFILIALITIILVIVFFYVYYSSTNGNSTVKKIIPKNLVYNYRSIFTSDSLYYSSNSINKIIFGGSSGLYIYDTETLETNKISDEPVFGLSFDSVTGLFLVLKSQNKLYYYNDQDDQFELYETNILQIYDTINGRYIKSTNDEFYYGEKSPKNPGNYGPIKFKIS